MQLGALTTTSIGSMPRPNWLAQTDRSRATFRLNGDALREAQDDATMVTLREQEELGLDIVTDGEQRREGFIFHMTPDLGRHRPRQSGAEGNLPQPLQHRAWCRASPARSSAARRRPSRTCASPRRTPSVR